jgi:hypothetical protein
LDEAEPRAYVQLVGEMRRGGASEVPGVMTRTREIGTRDLNAKADQFAAWAARAKARTLRNAYLSLEKTCRALAAAQRRAEITEQRANPN